MVGLLAYATGALAMALAQSLTAIIIFWAVVGGLGASLLLPAMQSLIHGNFQGVAQKKAYALVGAAAAIAAAVGPLLGGFITTYLSWRIAFLLEDVIILIVLLNIKLVRDVPYTGPRNVDPVGAVLSVLGMGGIVLGILVWQEGGEAVGALLVVGALAMVGLASWLVRRKREGKATLIDPDLFKSKVFRFGISGQMLQQIALGGTMIVLPIYLQMVFEYSAMQAGLSLAPLSLTMFGVALLAEKKAGDRRASGIIRVGFALLTTGLVILIPIVPRADSGWYLVIPLMIAGAGLGLLVSQLNNYTLAPDLGGAGQRGRRRQLGGRVVRALVRARLCRCDHAGDALLQLHQPGRVKHRAHPGGAAAGGRRAGAQRRGDDQHPAPEAAGRPAPADPGRDHQHQHRRPPPGASGGAADPDPGRPRRAVHLVPHDAHSRSPSRRLPRRAWPWADHIEPHCGCETADVLQRSPRARTYAG